jgi:hypothetical protein
MKGLLTLGIAIAATTLFGESKNEEYIRIQGVSRTPESVTVSVVVSYPKNGQLVKNPVWMQLRVDGYALGAASQFDRADELANTDLGQTIHVVIDNQPYFPINGPAIDPFNEEGYFYDTSYKFKLPKSLSSGEHVIRAFPARSFGESLKGDKTFFVSTINVNNSDSKYNADLSKPYLTYNEPSNNFNLVEGKPILLDFLLSNCELTPDGYKIRLTVDGKITRTLTSWQPYYLYGLKRGTHSIRLELLDRSDKLVPGPFNDITQSITVH